MKSFRRLFYKALFSIFIRNKYQRKNLYNSFSEFGLPGYFKRYKLSKKEALSNKEFKYFLSIVCIMKNEGPYLKEWIEFHKMVGVDHFYIYNNDSSDNTVEILRPYIDAGLVTYIDYPGPEKQIPAYNDAVKNFAEETQWMAIIDLDEFIVPRQNDNLKDLMNNYAFASQVSFRWVFYGSSGHIKQPEGLVIENFKCHAAVPHHSPKSIFNPRTVSYCGAHFMSVCGSWIDENNQPFAPDNKITVNKCQINHYACKSQEEFYNRKVARGLPDGHTFGDVKEFFDRVDKNDVEDEMMQPFADKLKVIFAQ